MNTVDYSGVPFQFSAETIEWLKSTCGGNWFQDIDPLLQQIRQTFNGEVARAELYCTAQKNHLHAKMFRREGGDFQQTWVCAFGPRGDSFSLVR